MFVNGKTSKVSTWVTDETRNIEAGTDINVTGGVFAALLTGKSVSTFVGELVRGSKEDLNHDGVVNIADIILLAAAFNCTKGNAKYKGYI